jgi:hypothetical protein
MALSLDLVQDQPSLIVDWPLPGRARFISSEAFRILQNSLGRYASGEITGRSMLISGHRGAGKTTLVLRAIDDYYRTVLADVVAKASAGNRAGLHSGAIRRPLLVKLHGPSLLGDLPRPRGELAAAPEGSAGANNGATPTGNRTADDAVAPATAPTEPAHGALVQVTIALYRALAAECATAFGLQVAGQDTATPEMAAQLRLDLDQGAEPDRLRGYWERIGCLARGVLWPQRVSEEAGFTDQGLREIIAMVTASQAFRVCAGVENRSERTKNSEARETVREGRAGVDLKDLANRLTGLSVGGLVGWGLAEPAGIPGAAGAGVGAALFSALALTWSSRRTTKRERNFDYTFIPDRTIATLDRDLPEVISRISAAGLAPIFVVDELDKLDEPEVIIGSLIKRLKYLTTDYGFFCFLTDRDYYDAVQSQLDSGAYPREHTYFSDRLFVLYRPEEMSSFLREVIKPETAEDQKGRAALAKLIVHDSKLNTVDVIRELARGWDEKGNYATPSESLTAQVRYQLRIAMQLAIELQLRDEAMAIPIGRNPSFAQIAVDALYMPSRHWEAEEFEVSLSENKLLAYLAKRLQPSDGNGPASVATPARRRARRADEARAAVLRVIGAAEFRLIRDFVLRLAEALRDFHQLREKLEVENRLDADERPLLEAITRPPVTGLLRRVEADRYEFLYDIYGRDLQTGRLIGRTRAIPDEIRPRCERAWRFADAMEGATATLGMTVPEMVEAELLPSTDWVDIRRRRDRMRAAVDIDETYVDLAADLPSLEGFALILGDHGRGLDRFLRLAMQVAHDAQSNKRLVEVLKDLRCYLDVTAVAASPDSDLPKWWPQSTGLPSAEANSISAWIQAIIAFRQQFLAARELPSLAMKSQAAWRRWARNMVGYFGYGRSVPETDYDDLVLIVADLLPASFFQRDLAKLGALDWSRLCLLGAENAARGVQRGGPPAAVPIWTIFASLRALQFDRDLLIQIVNELTESGVDVADDAGLMQVIFDGAAPAAPGVLVIVDDTSLIGGGISRRRPSLTIERHHIPEYKAALRWLQDHRVFAGVASEGQIDEQDQTDDQEASFAGVSAEAAAGRFRAPAGADDGGVARS